MIKKYYKTKLELINIKIKMIYKLETLCFNIRQKLMLKRYDAVYIHCCLNEVDCLKEMEKCT